MNYIQIYMVVLFKGFFQLDPCGKNCVIFITVCFKYLTAFSLAVTLEVFVWKSYYRIDL